MILELEAHPWQNLLTPGATHRTPVTCQALLDAALALAALARATRPPLDIPVTPRRPIDRAAAAAAAAEAAAAAAALPSFADGIAAGGGVELLLALLEGSSDPRLHAACVSALLSLACAVPAAPAAIAANGGVKACGTLSDESLWVSQPGVEPCPVWVAASA